ncbi:MAG: ATP-binding protein [bacterium]|nr:ATP-binding protein [bacterium]
MVSWKVLIKTLTVRGQRGLRWEILVSLGIIMLAGVLFMGATALKSAEKTILLQKLESLTQVTRSLQLGLSGWLGGGEGDGELPGFLRQTAAGVGISAFKVTDSRGRIVAGMREQEVESVTREPALVRALEKGAMVVPGEIAGKVPDEPRGTWTFAAPVYRKGVLVGAFAVSYPLENLGLVLGLHRRIVFTFAFLDAIVIVLFGGWLIGRVAVRPIVRISHGAQALAGGDYDARVPVQGPKEIAALSASFNAMADRVQEAVLKQEEHLTTLRRTNLELVRTQREMVRVEKLASVGRLAAGIAHEIGNPLSAILGYASILRREATDPEEQRHLGYIEGETERIRRIIQGLLDFSRPSDVLVEQFPVNELVRMSVELVIPQGVFRGVDVRMELCEEDPRISGDRHQLGQILVNILLNAAQAVEGKGTLEVVTEARLLTREDGTVPRRRATDRAEDDYATMRTVLPDVCSLREGDRVAAVTVTDSGPGIPAEVLERIFDPFFTTKGTGEGTGLGLSIAYGIVEAHGGRLLAGNVEEGGARFTILLPTGSKMVNTDTVTRRRGDAEKKP